MCSRVAEEDEHAHPRLKRPRTEIEARYWPRKWGVAAYLEVESIRPLRAPLPINNTGYRSHFRPSGTIESHGGDVVAHVIAWLDDEAASSAQRAQVGAHRQGEMFLACYRI